jgi:hypothetical protein
MGVIVGSAVGVSVRINIPDGMAGNPSCAGGVSGGHLQIASWLSGWTPLINRLSMAAEGVAGCSCAGLHVGNGVG